MVILDRVLPCGSFPSFDVLHSFSVSSSQKKASTCCPVGGRFFATVFAPELALVDLLNGALA